ncbi:putative inactive receptor kinase At3g08680 [Curcuma longa]|uniref:putative inactive receptor kinase At3g08680 n=1 Tax=Curcuma longa TaxID=136217 RepID=UPI003D9E20C5
MLKGVWIAHKRGVDLLRASPYVLGKGSKGIMYKVVVGEGIAVVVRRLGQGIGGGRYKDFEAEGRAMGRVRHGTQTLSAWEAESGVTGATPHRARRAHLHDCSSRKFVHGNFKPPNLLLDTDFNPHISDFNLLSISSSSSAAGDGFFGLPSSSLLDQPNPYCAPEARTTGRTTQNSDVYSFGVMLLELLTGKHRGW